MQKNVLVFDFDETLGSFSQLYTFWMLIKIFFNNNIEKKHFYSILDDNELFFRPNIFKIFNTIKNKKKIKSCSKVIIYSNNNAEFFWIEIIKDYIHHKLNYKLIDQIIRNYKIENKICEPCRTTYDKTFNDFIKCTELSKNTNICFFDDKLHENMLNDNVLYINLKPYNYNVKFETLIKKFYISNLKLFNNKNYNDFHTFVIQNTKKYNLEFINKTLIEKKIETILTDNIIKIIKKFANKNIFTKKNKKTKKNLTKKL